MVVGPKWLDTDRFDVVAKAPNTGPESGKSAGPPIDVDTLRTMLRALIVERFKMVSHREDQAGECVCVRRAKDRNEIEEGGLLQSFRVQKSFGTSFQSVIDAILRVHKHDNGSTRGHRYKHGLLHTWIGPSS